MEHLPLLLLARVPLIALNEDTPLSFRRLPHIKELLLLLICPAIARICGSDTPVSSTKSLTGHECWMSGASELLYTILMVSNGFLAGNANFNGPGPDDPIIGVFAQTREARVRAVLSNSFGFGGTNACVALKFDR